MGQVYRLITLNSETALNSLFEVLPINHPAKAPYSLFKQASDSVRSGVIIGLGSRLQVFQSELIKKITARDEIDLELPGQKRMQGKRPPWKPVPTMHSLPRIPLRILIRMCRQRTLTEWGRALSGKMGNPPERKRPFRPPVKTHQELRLPLLRLPLGVLRPEAERKMPLC